MKNNKFKNFFLKFSEILTNNISIIIISTLFISLVFMMYQKGFKISVDMAINPQQSALLVEDRVPSLAVYYMRERVPVTAVLDDETSVELDIKYNSNRLFEPYFEGGIPQKDGYLFTHFSLEPNGDPLDPGLRVTEPMTVYANWVEKPSILPYQVFARINYQIEIGRRRYVSYFYEYLKINKGTTTKTELNQIENLVRPAGETYEVNLRVDGKEEKEILDFGFGFIRLDTKKLTYDLNGGQLLVSTQPKSLTVPINASISEPPGVKKENFRHIGWSLTADGPIVPLEDILVSEDTILYAQYQPSLVKPDADSNNGRYLTTYFVEPINTNTAYLAISITDSYGELNEIVEAEVLEFDHLEPILYGEVSHRDIIFGGQFLIVSKKDKMTLLNEKVLAYTEVNPVGVILLVLMFATMIWSFLDNKNNIWKLLSMAILLSVIAILIFILPHTIKFSNYFQNVWNFSKEINPEGTNVSIMIGLIISGVMVTIGALFTYLAFALNLIISKHKKTEIIKDIDE